MSQIRYRLEYSKVLIIDQGGKVRSKCPTQGNLISQKIISKNNEIYGDDCCYLDDYVAYKVIHISMQSI